MIFEIFSVGTQQTDSDDWPYQINHVGPSKKFIITAAPPSLCDPTFKSLHIRSTWTYRNIFGIVTTQSDFSRRKY